MAEPQPLPRNRTSRDIFCGRAVAGALAVVSSPFLLKAAVRRGAGTVGTASRASGYRRTAPWPSVAGGATGPGVWRPPPVPGPVLPARSLGYGLSASAVGTVGWARTSARDNPCTRAGPGTWIACTRAASRRFGRTCTRRSAARSGVQTGRKPPSGDSRRKLLGLFSLCDNDVFLFNV